MTAKQNIIKIFTGNEVSVYLLKGLLEEIEVSSMIKNDFQAGVTAGFFGGTPDVVDLFISKEDLKKATPIIEDFLNNAE